MIDTDLKKAAYLQLYEQLRNDIIGGAYAYGAKLPSKRLLAEETGVSVVTVEHAYSLLCDEGYVESKEKSGFFVIFSENDFFSQREADVPLQNGSSFDEGFVGENFPFSVMAKTMRRVISDYGEKLL